LSTYQEAIETLRVDGEGSGMNEDGSESVMLLMSGTWHRGGYAELERCLCRLLAEHSRLYWHVIQRYIRSTRRVAVLRRHSGGFGLAHNEVIVGMPIAIGNGNCRGIVESWHPSVDPLCVDMAVEWIARNYRGDPTLPIEVFEAVAA